MRSRTIRRLVEAEARGRPPKADNQPVMPGRYVAPDWFTRNIFNRVVAALTRLGISVWGSRVLEVRGRKSSEPRRTPVNLLMLDGRRYLVAPRGHTQWVRNLRIAGEGELLLGRRRERFVGFEIPDSDKEPILRAYLERWKWEVGQFFAGVDAHSPSEDLRRIAPDHPVFRVETPPAGPTGATAGRS
jgi:deazaflavin-dependent oxidoreductase (nitroreductase family)